MSLALLNKAADSSVVKVVMITIKSKVNILTCIFLLGTNAKSKDEYYLMYDLF